MLTDVEGRCQDAVRRVLENCQRSSRTVSEKFQDGAKGVPGQCQDGAREDVARGLEGTFPVPEMPRGVPGLC